MKITATIKSVKDTPKEHTKDGRTTFYIDGEFQEGVFSLSAKSKEGADKTIADLKALAGTPKEYEVEEKGEYNGRPKYWLRDYPGKPAYQGGGYGGRGGGGYQPRYRDSEQGAKEERDSIARSVALQQAVLIFNGHPNHTGDVIATAETYYQWLVKNNKPISQAFDPGTQRATPASPSQAQARQAEGMVEKANRLFNDPEPEQKAAPAGGYQEIACPNCGESKHVRKSKLDGTPPWYCFRKLGGCGHQWGDYSPQLSSDQPAEPRSPAVLASEEISKAVKTKDMKHLLAIMDRVALRQKEGNVFSAEELHDLNIEIGTAIKAIESGQNHEEWYRKTLQAVQNREQEHLPEMQPLAQRF